MSSFDTKPSEQYEIITPDDDNDLPQHTRAIRVGGGAGDVEVHRLDGNTVVIPAMQVGETLPIRARRILAGNTTATGILAIY